MHECINDEWTCKYERISKQTVSYHCYKYSEVVINKTKVKRPQNNSYNLIYHGN